MISALHKYLPLIALVSILLSCVTTIDRPIQMAAIYGDDEAIAPLVAKGHDVNNIGFNGMTPLIQATFYGFAPTVRELLNHGADPNIQDDQKLTALHYAADYGRADIIKILLDAGADPTIEDIYGKTAEMYAEEQDRRGGGGFFLKGLFQIGRE